MYCPSIWFDSTVTAVEKLKITYNNGLRRLLNLPKYNSAPKMFVNLDIPSFGELERKFVFSYYEFRQPISEWYIRSATPLFKGT